MNPTIEMTLKKAKGLAKKEAKRRIKKVGIAAANNPKVVIGIGIGAGLVLAPYITIAALLGAVGAKGLQPKVKK